MRTWAIIAVTALQLAVLGYMAGEREWVLACGRVVWLRTAPVDPRDAMRGDYVRLEYDASRVPLKLCRGALADKKLRAKLASDARVYATLRENEEGLAEVTSLSDQPPSGGLFIRGRLDGTYSHTFGADARVRFGIEAFFVQQGKGRKMERFREPRGIQVPFEMEVAVSPGGMAVIKGYLLSTLGISTTVKTDTPSAANRWQSGPPQSAKIQLWNAGTNDLAIVNLHGTRSLALTPASDWNENPWRWVNADEPQPRPTAADVIVLKPDQCHTFRVDFKDPAWAVIDSKETNAVPHSLAEALPRGFVRFRLEYRPPDRAACAGLPNADLIWHGRLPSRAITSYGVD
jgi:uncharacterized membrane-anchored protein